MSFKNVTLPFSSRGKKNVVVDLFPFFPTKNTLRERSEKGTQKGRRRHDDDDDHRRNDDDDVFTAGREAVEDDGRRAVSSAFLFFFFFFRRIIIIIIIVVCSVRSIRLSFSLSFSRARALGVLERPRFSRSRFRN